MQRRAVDFGLDRALILGRQGGHGEDVIFTFPGQTWTNMDLLQMGKKWLAKETHLCWLEVSSISLDIGNFVPIVLLFREIEKVWPYWRNYETEGGLWKYVALPHFWLPSLLWVVMTSLSFILLPPCLCDALVSCCNGLLTLQNSELPGCLVFVSLKQTCACICSQFCGPFSWLVIELGGSSLLWVVPTLVGWS